VNEHGDADEAEAVPENRANVDVTLFVNDIHVI
jgi:hypothetical protein